MKVSDPLRLHEVTAVPWKNGGGTTRTLAVAPAGVGMDDFDWRISLATVASSGGFSHFAGVDRTIMLYRGQGMVLESLHWRHELTVPFEPFRFSGEDDVHCALAEGTSVDLNLMVRRSRASGEIAILHSGSNAVVTMADEVVLLCTQGTVSIPTPLGERKILRQDEFLRVSDIEKSFELRMDKQDTLLVCAIVRLLR